MRKYILLITTVLIITSLYSTNSRDIFEKPDNFWYIDSSNNSANELSMGGVIGVANIWDSSPLGFSSNPAKAKKWSYVDQKAIFLLISISLVLIFTAMPLYNVKLSKLISEVYSRRMVSFQETYFIYWIALVLAVFSGRILKISRLYSAILILFLIILSVNITLRLKDRLYDNTWNRDYILLQEDNVFDYIRENIEPWSVIASYKYVAMDVVAQTPNYFISSNTVHMPYIQDYRDRKKATSIILSFKEPIEIILDSCQKYNVSFILTEYNNYDSFAPVYDLIKFNDAVSVYPELFHIVFSDERYVLYKVRI